MDARTSLRRRVGDTPLLQSKALNEALGLPNLWLKLEGSNPTGTQKDRIARLDVAEALRRGCGGVTAGSCGNFGVALSHAAYVHGLPCHIFVPEDFQGERVALMEDLGATVHRVPGQYEDAVAASQAYAKAQGIHDANPGGINTLQTLTGYSRIADEVLERVHPAAVGVPVGNGTTLAGVHLGFRNAWARGRAKEVPRVYAGSSQDNNPLAVNVARGVEDYTPMDPRAIVETEVNEPLVNWDCLDGRAALEAVQSSQGAAYGHSDEELLKLHALLEQDGFDAHPASLAAVAALQAAVAEGDVPRDADLVAVLTSGRANIQVDRLDALPEDFHDRLTSWLGRFGDPLVEMREAVAAALRGGHVLTALDGDQTLGYCVLTPMELDTFFPHLHLSYIAVSPEARGRGVGTVLLEEAIRVADGDLSLHVETDNEAAIRLYEKFGFDRKYYRMLYRAPRTAPVDAAQGSGWSGSPSA
ncbi:MAG: pyridoxal-phosphate dependent enzyme [Thermoplasmatota archaeon]